MTLNTLSILIHLLLIRCYIGFPGGTSGKEPACYMGLISGSRRSPGGGNGNPLQYSCLLGPRNHRSVLCSYRFVYSRAYMESSNM